MSDINPFFFVPNDALNNILSYLSIYDIIYLHRVDKTFLSLLEQQYVLNKLLHNNTDVCFKNFLKSYNKKFITRNSPIYFPLEECLSRCGAEGNIECAQFFKDMGENSFCQMMKSACESGNIDGFEFAKNNLPGYLFEALLSDLYSIAAEYGRLCIIKYIEKCNHYPCNILYNIAAIIASENGHLEVFDHIIRNDFGSITGFDIFLAYDAAVKRNQYEMGYHIFYDFKHRDYDMGSLFIDIIYHDNFELFKMILSDKRFGTDEYYISKSFILKYAIEFKRLDMIICIAYNYTFDLSQKDIDMITLSYVIVHIENYKSISSDKIDDFACENFIIWALKNNTKLYGAILMFGFLYKNSNIIDSVIKSENPFQKFYTSEYIISLVRKDEIFQLKDIIGELFASHLGDIFGHITYNHILIYAATFGYNKYYIDMAISKGANQFKTSILCASIYGRYELAEHISKAWKNSLINDANNIINSITNMFS